MVKYLQEYLIEQNEEIVEINDKMFKARTKLDEIIRWKNEWNTKVNI